MKLSKAQLAVMFSSSSKLLVIPPCWRRQKKLATTASIPTIEAILKEEMQMADWLIKHIPQTTEQFLLRSEADGVEAKK
ncbi:Protein YciE [Salmonella enterica subsp. enterica]|nr:Protein YciE [Salmonella enterica subsp. enterica]